MYQNLDRVQSRIVDEASANVEDVIDQLKSLIVELDNALTDAKDKIAELESEHQK